MATNFATIVDEVHVITNRPDLVAETALAIKQATIKLHGLENWKEDIVEEEIEITPGEGVFEIDIRADLDYTFKKLLYMQKKSNGKFMTEIGATALFDDYNNMKTNIFYQVGTKLKGKIDTVETLILLGYVKAVDVAESTYSSWIADLYSFMISTEAAIIILNGIGESSKVKLLQSLSKQHIALLDMNHLPVE